MGQIEEYLEAKERSDQAHQELVAIGDVISNAHRALSNGGPCFLRLSVIGPDGDGVPAVDPWQGHPPRGIMDLSKGWPTPEDITTALTTHRAALREAWRQYDALPESHQKNLEPPVSRHLPGKVRP